MHMRIVVSLAVLLCTACFSESDVDVTAGVGADDSTTVDADDGSEVDGSTTTTRADDGSSDTTSAAESSTGIAPSCGDGHTDADEACDDANDDELDGCTRACARGPVGFTLTTVLPPPVLGDGTVGDELFCVDVVSPRPLLLGGLSGHRGGVSTENAWTVSVGGSCSNLGLVDDAGMPALALADDPIMLPEQGNTVGQIDTFALACPDGATPIGIDGRIYSGTLPYVASVRLQCATPRLVEQDGVFTVQLEAAAPSDWTPTGTTHDEQSATCPEGSVAVGFRGAIDARDTAIYALGPLCATIGVVTGAG